MKRKIKRKDNEDRLFDFIKCREMRTERIKKEDLVQDTPVSSKVTGTTSQEGEIKQEFYKDEIDK